MELEFKLQVFEGPLDLLLHLIEINKVDIYDIPVAEITDQYMAYIRQMQIEDMDLTSDFLVMAATLLRIKSKMLLPAEKKEIDEGGEDPRMELVERLLEYKKFKYAALELQDLEVEASFCHFREKQDPKKYGFYETPPDPEELLEDVSMNELRRVFTEVLKRKQEMIDPIRSRYGRIEQEPVKLSDKIVAISRRLKNSRKPVTFQKLLGKQTTKEDVVVTFLAVLEMMRRGTVKVKQEALFEDIYLIAGGENES